MHRRVVEPGVRRDIDDAGVHDMVDTRVDGRGNYLLMVASHPLGHAVARHEHERTDVSERLPQGRGIVVVGSGWAGTFPGSRRRTPTSTSTLAPPTPRSRCAGSRRAGCRRSPTRTRPRPG